MLNRITQWVTYLIEDVLDVLVDAGYAIRARTRRQLTARKNRARELSRARSTDPET